MNPPPSCGIRLRSDLPESAGSHLVRNVPTVRSDATCGSVLRLLQQHRFDYADVTIVMDTAGCVAGISSTSELLSMSVDMRVGDCIRTVELATEDMDQERIASLAIQNPLGAVPVIDAHHQFVGLVPPQAVLAILRHEHVEDLHRFAGILRETEVARAALEGPPTRRARHRLPWLFVGLGGSALAALVMARFEALMQTQLAIVYFLPGIVYLADAIGTQTEAIAVHGLSLSHMKLSSLVARELWTGVLIGGILGIVSAGLLWAVLQDVRLAVAVGAALFAAGSIATFVGLMLPWAFQRFGFDPAYGSGPLATVIQDVLSLLVYFACVMLLVIHR